MYIQCPDQYNHEKCQGGVFGLFEGALPPSAPSRKTITQSPIPTSLLLCEKMLGWMKLCILTITFIFPCLCTFWHAIPTSHFIFNDFSFLSYIQVHAAESKSCNIENLQSLFTFLNLIFQSFGFCPKSLVMRI